MLENEKSGPKGGWDRFQINRNTIREEGVSRYLCAANSQLWWNSGGIKGGELPPPLQTS